MQGGLEGLSQASYEACQLCPRNCRANRTRGDRGLCGMGSTPTIARAALHFWEEPPISGTNGSGTIFFTGCPLRCVYCQNVDISHRGYGQEVSTRRLAAIMLELEAQGAHNINLVTALHFAPHITEAVTLAKSQGLTIPIVCNTSGYEREELVDLLKDVIDIWLVDMKYASSDLAKCFSYARDYPDVAARALKKMVANVEAAGGRQMTDNGLMTRGIIVRHLLLPGHLDDTLDVISRVYDIAGDTVDLSLMNQYTPNSICAARGDELSGPIDDESYEISLVAADTVGFSHIWWQQGGTVSESFIPAFDSTGVEGPEL